MKKKCYKITKLETNYAVGDASDTNAANKNIRELVEQLKQKPEIGARLQGDIFNNSSSNLEKTGYLIFILGISIVPNISSSFKGLLKDSEYSLYKL